MFVPALTDLASHNCTSLPVGKGIKDLPGGPEKYILEPKLDGFRLICHVRKDHVEMYTRAMKRQDGKLPHIEAQLLESFPEGTVVDGEITARMINDIGEIDNDFQLVQSVMLSKPLRAVARQEEVRPLDYVLFDCTFFNGIDVRQKSYSSRRAHLFRSIGCVNLEVNAALEAEQSTHDALVAHGYEGTIAKLLLGPYVNNACGKGWYKFKAVFEMDAIITGFIPGTPGSAFDGKIGGIVFAQPGNDGQLIDRGSASGLTLMLRDEISLDPDVYIGEVVAIKHMGLMPDGIHVRHPQFSRWRPDKLSTQVRWAER